MWGGQTAFGQLGSIGALGQSGQMGMAPAGGLVNRAVAGFQQLDENGPGWLYYGVNAADRGLGYNGSYFTLGGFIPYAEDDLGGLWSADLRSHLSTYGGFFSNVGVVRKQFMGGTIGGIGVYWDYDADLNQYPTDGTVCAAPFGQFGHIYNQVGVSAEWLTDYGNLRSNGYIPVGTTAYTAGNPGSVFFQNYVMSNYGLDAGLAGADLEVGAYVPGLADWAGMVSVGGYTFGQARYNWSGGSKVGQDLVPYFGGVYTRLDLTLMRNWDFSLQANNDSFFDWTGFARLTYRMGGSRRRNVPDQMEQPMMRNEHIVRAHQTPEVACNPVTKMPWHVIHVNNAPGAPAAAPAAARGPMAMAAGPMALAAAPATATAPPAGTGTAESPFTTLAAADAAATRPWDIVLVSRGNGTSTGYDTEFSFNAPNQSLVGVGSPFYINSSCSGPINIAGPSGPLPLLSNPAGASVFIDGNVAGGATVANLQMTGSQNAIFATGNLNGLPTAAFPDGRPTTVNNVSITGSGTADPQQGVYLQDTTGVANFTNTSIANMTQGGFVVDGGAAVVNYQGSITNDSTGSATPAGYLVAVQGMIGGEVNLAVGGAPASATVQNNISDTGGQGVLIQGNADGTFINMSNVSLTDNVNTAIAVIDDSATTTITAGAGTGIEKSTAGSAISIEGGSPNFTWQGAITNSGPSGGAASYLLNVNSSTNAVVSVSGPGLVDTGNGIQIIQNDTLQLAVDGANITSAGGTGILMQDNLNTSGTTGLLSFTNTTISGATSAGVLINNPTVTTGTDATPVQFSNLNINLPGTTAVGFTAVNAGAITVGQNSSITNASTTLPAIMTGTAVSFTGTTGPLNMTFTSINSSVLTTGTAMSFISSTGTVSVTSSFLVSGTSGSAANVSVLPAPGTDPTVLLPP